jgi:hypothetical protein
MVVPLVLFNILFSIYGVTVGTFVVHGRLRSFALCQI